MIPSSNQIAYACISRETTVLADFCSGDGDLQTLALQCLERAPPFHRSYSHTTKKRIYCFLIDSPFVYFAVADEALGKLQCFRLLERLKSSFTSFLKAQSIRLSDDLTSHCFQEDLGPVFRFLTSLSDRDLAAASGPTESESRMPILWTKEALNSGRGGDGNTADSISGRRNDVCDRPLSPQKHVSPCDLHSELQRARGLWWQQARIIMIADLVVCCVLFGVWLAICKGFRCIDH